MLAEYPFITLLAGYYDYVAYIEIQNGFIVFYSFSVRLCFFYFRNAEIRVKNTNACLLDMFSTLDQGVSCFSEAVACNPRVYVQWRQNGY